MNLKPILNDYTEPEFQALVDRIWAVDLPKADHDRLINHFDQIAGHPKGADLLFYHPEDDPNPNSSGSVVYYVKDWHRKQGRAAFKGQAVPTATPVPARSDAPVNWAQITQQRIAQSLADVQKVAVDLAASERAAQTSLGVLEQRINHVRRQQSVQVDISEREKDIRELEVAEFEARRTEHRYRYWKMSIEFKRDGARREQSYAQAERAQWQNIAQQFHATYDRYVARLADINQRLKQLQVEAERLLEVAQTRLVDQRHQQGVGPTQVPTLLFAPLAFANARPGISLDGGLSQPLENHRVDLQKSIRSAVAEFTWQITSGTDEHQGRYAAVLQFDFSSRAEIGHYGVCVPLPEFLPIEGLDWRNLAATRGEVDVPFRLCSGNYAVPKGTLSRGIREIDTLNQVTLIPTNGRRVSSSVRVRSVVWDEALQAYCFISDGQIPVTVCWKAPGAFDSEEHLAPVANYRLGFLRSSHTPLLERFDETTTVRFDDYVVVFPTDSGLDPLYVIFRDLREVAPVVGR